MTSAANSGTYPGSHTTGSHTTGSHTTGSHTAGSYTAGLENRVCDRIRPRLRTAESLGLGGEPDKGLRMLGELCAGLPGEAGPDHIAIAEVAVLLHRWGGDGDTAREICDAAVRQAGDPATRATLLIARARATAAPDDLTYQSRALAEFSAAGDGRGRALALGRMASPTEGSEGPSNEHRARLGRQGLGLAMETGDPYTIALCAANLAVCETYLGRAGALRRWRQVVRLLPPSPDPSTAELTVVHHANWALTATAFGDFAQAAQALDEGRSVAYPATWIRTFDAVEAVLLWRRGELAEAVRRAARAAQGGRHWSSAIAEVVHAAVAIERDRRLRCPDLDEAVRVAVATSHELGYAALAVQARIRAVRREPLPCRDLAPALAQVRRRKMRFGWEDMLLALAQIDPELAARELPLMDRLWPPGDRARAIREFVTGVTAGRAGFGRLLAAAELLHRIGETVTAGQAYHAAARLAASTANGNRLRGVAIELLQAAGADRSLAAVVRDRTLHRGPNLVPVPDSQRYQRSPGLTPREREVALLAARGLTASEIAKNLGISLGTARNHLLSVRQKFGGVPKRKLGQLLAVRE